MGKISDKKVVEPLLDILKEEEELEVRQDVVMALAYLKDERAIEPLLEILKTDNDQIIRNRITYAFQEIKSKKVIEPLIDILKNDRDGLIRSSAASVLGILKDKRAIEALKEVYEELKGEKNDFKGAYPRCSIIKALGEQGEVDFLIEALKDKDGLIIRDAARALVEIGDKRAVEPLIETFKNRDDKRFIGHLLADLGDKRAIKPLEEALNDPRNAGIKDELAIALKKLTGKDYQY